MRLILVLIGLALLLGCAHFNGPDHEHAALARTGPDLSSSTQGPFYLPARLLHLACGNDRAWGCTICGQTWCVIYVLEGAPRFVEANERVHAAGAPHPGKQDPIR